jgi:TRAP-type uncharacterized transport system fused permease subunit
MKVGLIAVQLALPAFIAPFIFVYHPELLLVYGVSFSILYSIVTVFLGVYALAAT